VFLSSLIVLVSCQIYFLTTVHARLDGDSMLAVDTRNIVNTVALPGLHRLRMRITVYTVILAIEISLHMSCMPIQNVSFLHMFELTNIAGRVFPHFGEAEMSGFVQDQCLESSQRSLGIHYVYMRAVAVLFGVFKSNSGHNFRRTILGVRWLRHIILCEHVILDRSCYSLI
jgi:hypothetical protein